ncbi:hypothetical protein AB0B56_13955 [Streptosporangium canum]|uniref:hypothetical protein n=1 Tax=Streptosporangium canum TaxID=324952 RepID=UPI003445BA86
MSDTSTESASLRSRPLVPEMHIGWALVVAFLSWILGGLTWFLVSSPIESKECGLDPLSYESENCAPVSAWVSVTAYGWLASPLVWTLAVLFLWLVPDRWGRAQQVAVWSIPALPVGIVVAQIIVYVLYGPSLL